MQPIHYMEVENEIDGSDKEGNLPVLPSGKIANPTEDDMSVIFGIGITIDVDNDPAPENFTEQKEQQQGNGQ